MTSPIETPEAWPKVIAESYSPLRVLGTGGFASVMLARRADPQSTEDGNNNVINGNCNTSVPTKVAIKVVGCNDGSGNHDAAVLYARREIELLQQICHVGIVKLFYAWERREQDLDEEEKKAERRKLLNGTSPTAGVLVLEYIKGPTVEKLLKHGGALSTTFARVVIAQVMDAMAYLHYRAVVHRDIKPDNIMVTGALSSDSFIWDNEEGANDNRDDNKSPEEWKQLCLKYKATIIDFGFARALTPGDMEGATTETMMKSMRNLKPGYYDKYEEDCDKEKRQKKKANEGGAAFRKIFRSNSGNSLSELDDSMRSNGSVSHKMKRVMSTLGNRNYVAPEIIEKVRPFTAQEKGKEKKRASLHRRTSETCNTISNFVADYGLLVDSYSMGHTIRYMMTGVEPGTSVDEAIKKQNRSKKASKMLKMVGLKKKKEKSGRKPQYRSLRDIPGQIFLLIKELTELSPKKRISIRKARRMYDWVSNVLSFQEADEDQVNASVALGVLAEKPKVSLGKLSEEQLHALDETHYLPLATPNPESVISNDSELRPTNQTIQTLAESPSTSDTSNPAYEEEDGGSALLEDDMITF